MACLARPWAATAPGGQLGGVGEGRVDQLGRLDHPVDQADGQRLVGADLATAEDEVLGPARARPGGPGAGCRRRRG